MNDKTNARSLLTKWKESGRKHAASTRIAKAPENAKIPPSHGQQRLWFLQHLYPNSSVYNYSEIYTFKGQVQPENLKNSLQQLFRNHTIFKSSFAVKEGSLLQKTDPQLEITIKDLDISGLAPAERESEKMNILKADAATPFYLDSPPLIRPSLIRVAQTEWILLVTLHHIITDKWSMGVFREELARNYKILCSNKTLDDNPPEIQFSDYAYWQHGQELDTKQLNYWKEKLSGTIPYLELPTDNETGNGNTLKGATIVHRLPNELSKKIIGLSRALDTTPYVFLLSVYYLLLYRYSGQNDILIGSPISNRKEKELESLIGFFDETIVLRTTVSQGISFTELVKNVRETTMGAFSNMDIHFDQLIKEVRPERLPGRNPLFRTMFIYHDVPPALSFGPDIEFSYNFINSGVSKFDLTLYIANDQGLLSSSFEYATDLFTESTIQRFQEHFKLLLQGIAEDPSMELQKIPMLTSWERQFFHSQEEIIKGPFHHYKAIHSIISDVADKSPELPAVVLGDESISYGELNRKADRMAEGIVKHTGGKKKIIGLCSERSLEMIIGLLGILKSGCAYLPIDPAYPRERIEFMLLDSEAPLVLTQKSLEMIFENCESNVLLIEELVKAETIHSIPIPPVDSGDLAYIIYTSGSSGNPKGVPISHGNIINSTEGRLLFYPSNPKAFLLMSSISFDSSKAGIYWTLCTGGTLVIAENRLEQDIVKLQEVISSKAITHTLMLPSLYKLILEQTDRDHLQSLSAVIVAGEACPSSLPVLHFITLPEVALYNEYGPTEATVWCIAHQIKKEDSFTTVPIGKPVANSSIYILNKDLETVPYGSKGEIYIGGPGLSGTYLNRSDITEKAYMRNPFGAGRNEILYKTGDLGRYNKDGNLEFLGRADEQIKIRGYRVEPDEIVKVISGYDGVKEAVVVVEDTMEDPVPPEAGSIPSARELMKLIEAHHVQHETEVFLDRLHSLEAKEKEFLLQQIRK